ncbi:MAG: ATP-dependent DNA helicase RecQ [Rhodothermales bacterium]|jgi:ATP-dependent DNA helicase RecQ
MTYDRPEGLRLLKKHWGYDDFRDGQEGVVRSIVEGRDTLVVMPTGGGKSLCYQLPALLLNGITLVISPLIALMEDQVSQMTARGIQAECIHGSMPFFKREHAWSRVEHGGVRLLFLSPETVSGDVFQARVERLGIVRVAVDEAHCVSEWGHDFRPVYRTIPDALRPLGPMPVAAFTATAPPRVRADICTSLQLEEADTHIHAVDRPNIRWSVIRDENLMRHVKAVLSRWPGSGIVYAGTRHNADAWARRLTESGVSCQSYHAGLSPVQRRATQDAWTKGGCRVVAATSAFGMGIDKADVRFVIHTMLPGSLEAYYQEAGRAGRDGLPAEAVLISPQADSDRVRQWAQDRYPSNAQLRRIYDVSCDLASVTVGMGNQEPFVVDSDRIASVVGVRSDRVRSALTLLESLGVWSLLRPDVGRIRIQMTSDRGGLKSAMLGYPSGHPIHNLADAILRADYVQAPGGCVDVTQRALADLAGIEEDRLYEGLRHFKDRGLIEGVMTASVTQMQLNSPRSSRPRLGADKVDVLRRRALARADDVIVYASVLDCRRRVILNYFGEASPAKCGACDNCLS